jgi:hypothetical protein
MDAYKEKQKRIPITWYKIFEKYWGEKQEEIELWMFF